MPFLDHLEELRWRILWSLLAVAVASAIGFGLVYYYNVLDLLIAPVRAAKDDPTFRLVYLSPADPFFITLKLGIWVGVIMAFPVVAYQIWSFLSPALEKSERRAIIPALYLGLVLFVAGVAMAYYAALPVTLQFFESFQGEAMVDVLEIRETLGFITKLLLAFGIVFELPVVIMVLTAVGLVTPEFLRQKRRHAMVANTVLASLITPGDVITLTVMMMVPLFLLYELSIILSRGIYRRRAEREKSILQPDTEPPPGAVEAD
ncbi:MAG: twin-arginine translocase subunit TatC [Gemmatimonadota bacterium]|nr:twin-arginine translocase subunit TatC [Gemmatimonadota bacterium]MDH5759781.1 twin-arginine translocase subunit TatC [Gemmatimonadota bacterium]